jgi:DNA invertase Pin-like site-specific DNA recombinase
MFMPAKKRTLTKAVAYYRTSSQANVGAEKDSLPRQKRAVESYAKANGYEIVASEYDKSTSGKGSLALDDREMFPVLISTCREQNIHVILVEKADRFARDLMVQESGYQQLKGLGIQVIPVDMPDLFETDGDPTRDYMRQQMGSFNQLVRAQLVDRLKTARNAKKVATGAKVEGRKSCAEKNEGIVKRVRSLRRRDRYTGKVMSLRNVAMKLYEEGYTSDSGKPLSKSVIERMINSQR